MFESTKQSVRDQGRAFRKNDWLSDFELEAIKRQVEDEFQGKLCKKKDVVVEAETETDVGTVEEEFNLVLVILMEI